MSSVGKCPIDQADLKLTDEDITCPQCGFAITEADWSKDWKRYDDARALITKRLINDLLAHQKKDTTHESEKG